jgi:glycosyltransferase involved in cell wall biosynthesis
MLPNPEQQGADFGVKFEWDVPLLEGYKYEVLENVSRNPSVVNFRGCDTPSIISIIRDRKFDAVIVNGWVVKSCIQALGSCVCAGVPCIVRGESNALRKRRWPVRFIHRLLLKNYSAFLAIGKANRDFYLQNGVPPEKIFTGPYCVDNEFFASRASELAPQRNELRNKWGIPESALTFLFCGKFVDKKHPLDVVKGFASAVEETDRKISLLMVGDGELKEACVRFTEEKGLPVTFAGFLNQGEIADAYVASDIMVLASDTGETWGLVVNEAMACGLPAIVSDQVGCRQDLITPFETGLVFPCGDTSMLGEKMVWVASHEKETRDMGEQARLRVADYDVDTVVRGTLDALRYVT